MQNNPDNFDEIADIKPAAINTDGDVAKLADAIHTHLSPWDDNLHHQMKIWHQSHNNMADAIKLAAHNVVDYTVPVVKKAVGSLAKGAVDTVTDLTKGIGEIAFCIRPDEDPHQPVSPIGKLATRAGLATFNPGDNEYNPSSPAASAALQIASLGTWGPLKRLAFGVRPDEDPYEHDASYIQSLRKRGLAPDSVERRMLPKRLKFKLTLTISL